MEQRLPPSPEEFAAMADQALSTLPKELAVFLNDVVFRIEELPDTDVQKDLKLDSPFDLLGLYQGVAIGDKSILNSGTDVDMIFLYRRPILDYWCESGEDLAHLIRHVVIHEIGHHFGFSDADMERIEAQDS
ncbi:MAG: metallopeptidase family protein [Magnetovibrio sp.]|nr:metallopeptidase family protein [Magnetovibrio sp.]